jgi:hypothetical protein
MGLICPLSLVAFGLFVWIVLKVHDANRPMRQFSIGGLFVYTFLWAVCFSQVSRMSLQRTEAIDWSKDWVVLFAWLVLGGFYAWQRKFASLLIHVGGGLISLIIGFLPSPSQSASTAEYFGWRWFIGMMAGSFMGLFFFTAMTFLEMLRDLRAKRGKPTDSSPEPPEV